MKTNRSSLFGKLAIASAFSLALLSPGLAAARQVTLTANLKSYSGNGAYLAVYVTDANGKYQTSLWMAGGKAKYYKHMTGWARSGGTRADLNGITGASVGSGGTLKVTVDVADALIDAGYNIVIDSAVENQAEAPADAMMPLTSAGSGKAVGGKVYVKSFAYAM